MNAGAGLPSPGPAGFATGLAVPVLETGKGGGKTGAALLIPALKGGT